jgi:hypothetical protein
MKKELAPNDTAMLREKMLGMWEKFEAGEITGTDARTHIGFARTVLETLKVEIAAAHLNLVRIPPIGMSPTRIGKSNQQ